MIRLELSKEMYCKVDIDMSAYTPAKELKADDLSDGVKQSVSGNMYDALTYASLEAKGALFGIMQKIYLEFERSSDGMPEKMSLKEIRDHMCEVIGCNREEFEAFLMLA